MLNDKKESGQQTEWHTFTDKNTHLFKVMARGLDPATDPRAIVQNLETKGFKIMSAINILKTEFKKDPIGYNHVRSSCHRRARCVKCTGEHLTEACPKPTDTPKCTNCGEAHTANYRGCIVAKELQKRRNKVINSKKIAGKQLKQIVKDRQAELKKTTGIKQAVPDSINANAAYAEKAAHGNSKTNKTLNARGTAKIIEALEKLISRFDQQEKLNKMKFDMIEGELAKIMKK
ncbi:nucleic-acid-binding protein from transposon x-element [Lasius niger]|uniref:Nucleic-acid-binding protein from transposon x-element n=1 Tax=Lasius niger TaxID=67767 RepID=A0A0J7MWG9_LASNI|nr:nucleic-acid-binding protein from transposon x-element [Lasius niger]